MIKIRNACPGDAPGIARVHVDSWRTTYRGIMPAAYLDALSVEQRTRFWEPIIADASRPEFVVVAEAAEGQIVGFASGGPERTGHALYRGELSAVYLPLEYQRRGIGRRLVSAVAARLVSDGFVAMLLWVLAENPACRFYETLGGRRIMSKPVSVGGIELEEVAYGWQSLAGLIE